MKKKEERTLKRKTLLKAGLGRNSFETATGQPPNKKKSSRSPETLFYIRCKMTDYLKNIGNRYLPSLSLIRSVCSFNIRSVAQWDIVVSTYLQMVQQLQTGTHIDTYFSFLLINSRFLFKIEIKVRTCSQINTRQTSQANGIFQVYRNINTVLFNSNIIIPF